MSPIKTNIINRPHETTALYVSTWERLPDALDRIVTQTERPKAEVQKALCQAISDGAIRIRCKLGCKFEGHTTSLTHTSNEVLDGTAFRVPTEINSEDLDWERSRPTKPWAVRREVSSARRGYWLLDWIELTRADVTNAFCTKAQDELARSTRGTRGRTKKRSPAKERAIGVIKELFPGGVPDQAVLPNVLLCRQVGDKLKEKNLPNVSNDTILRAAGRCK